MLYIGKIKRQGLSVKYELINTATKEVELVDLDCLINNVMLWNNTVRGFVYPKGYCYNYSVYYDYFEKLRANVLARRLINVSLPNDMDDCYYIMSNDDLLNEIGIGLVRGTVCICLRLPKQTLFGRTRYINLRVCSNSTSRFHGLYLINDEFYLSLSILGGICNPYFINIFNFSILNSDLSPCFVI